MPVGVRYTPRFKNYKHLRRSPIGGSPLVFCGRSLVFRETTDIAMKHFLREECREEGNCREEYGNVFGVP
jgi:hypothetical protein